MSNKRGTKRGSRVDSLTSSLTLFEQEAQRRGVFKKRQRINRDDVKVENISSSSSSSSITPTSVSLSFHFNEIYMNIDFSDALNDHSVEHHLKCKHGARKPLLRSQSGFGCGGDIHETCHYLLTHAAAADVEEVRNKLESEQKNNNIPFCACIIMAAVVHNREDLLDLYLSQLNIDKLARSFFYIPMSINMALMLDRPCLSRLVREFQTHDIQNHFLNPQGMLPMGIRFLFNMNHAQKMLELYQLSALQLIVSNITQAFFHILDDDQPISYYHPYLQQLMDLSVIFYPGMDIRPVHVFVWLRIAAYCMVHRMSWIRPCHVRLWRCFAYTHDIFMPMDVTQTLPQFTTFSHWMTEPRLVNTILKYLPFEAEKATKRSADWFFEYIDWLQCENLVDNVGVVDSLYTPIRQLPFSPVVRSWVRHVRLSPVSPSPPSSVLPSPSVSPPSPPSSVLPSPPYQPFCFITASHQFICNA